MLVQGPRRIGKTTLIRQAVPSGRLIEANLYGAKSYEHCEAIVTGAIERYIGTDLLQEKSAMASGGILGFGVGAQFKKAPAGDLLQRAFNALIKIAEKRGDSPVLLIDEAQTMIESHEGINFAKRLRTELQRSLHCLCGVFAGSNSAVLSKLHSDNSSPFYKQLESMNLDTLPRDSFFKWIIRRLKANKLDMERAAFEAMADFCRDVCGDIQRIMESLFYRVEPNSIIGSKDVKEAIEGIVSSAKSDSLPILDSLTSNQLTLFIYLSIRDRSNLDFPISGKQSQLAMGGMPAGSIKTSIEALARIGIITHWNGRIFPDNPFLEETILRIQPSVTSGIVQSVLEQS